MAATAADVLAGDALWCVEHTEVLAGLRRLPDGCIQTCCTSPPYFGLRDYGTGRHEGGNWVDEQIGLEETPDEFVDKLVAVFSEVRRVLHPTGSLWMNMGDGYANDGKWGGHTGGKHVKALHSSPVGRNKRYTGLKPKDLIGMPWMLAFALRADGWYLRAAITWAKISPMPESVRDRPTRATEMLFLLTKGQSKTRSVKFADVVPELVHFGKNFGAQPSGVGASGLCVSLATALFDAAQKQCNFSLPPFYAEEWKQQTEGDSCCGVAGLPAEQWPTAYAARLLSANMTTKDFLGKLHCLWRDLGKHQAFLKCWRSAAGSYTRNVLVNSDGSVTVNDSGKICKVDFVHGCIVDTVPLSCNYFYDQDTERVSYAPASLGRYDYPKQGTAPTSRQPDGDVDRRTREEGIQEPNSAGRNLWDWWEVPDDAHDNELLKLGTEPQRHGHYASFPTEIPRKTIRLGSSASGQCPHCAFPWWRVTERKQKKRSRPNELTKRDGTEGTGNHCGNTVAGVSVQTLGWAPSCKCPPHEPVPQIVLDVFSGSGTTGLVARRLGRRYIGFELAGPEAKVDYVAMSRQRIAEDAPLMDAAQKPANKKPAGLFDALEEGA